MNFEESALVKKAAHGDMDAFEELARCYQNKIYAHALRLLRHPEDAFDVSQEVLLRLYRSLSSFRGQASLSTWIYRITQNACIDFCRSRKETVSLEEMGDWNQEVGEVSDSEAAVLRGERKMGLWRCINKLPAEQKAVLVLRDVEDYPYEDIARLVDAPLGTVKSRLKRAREKLL
ncbi:MAG: sigma-70 family RNA polymerase sigma factor, partial [Christensenellaceae bacterium]|nr:sigma-70 family RNA polymerase sigma factor [Christensenellaceae bacterium]